VTATLPGTPPSDAPPADDTTRALVLAPDAQRTLVAACARIVPHADADALAARVRVRLGTLDADRRRELAQGLALFGSRLAALASVGRATPFAALPPALQDRMLDAWGRSPLDACRTLFQVLRRLALLAHYVTPEGQREAGMRGPLWSREPALAWEGPAHGAATAPDEPVLRSGAAWTRSPDLARPASLHDARTLRGTHRLVADAVVIGSGAGGGVAAARLAEAGKEVIVLETGEYLRGTDFTEEDAGSIARLYAAGGLQGTDDASVAMLQGRAVGGGTTVNWMIMLRTPDHVLDEWGRRFGLEGMSPAELAPVFARIEDEVHARLVPSDAHSRANRLLLDGARTLGWQVEEGRINAKGCVRSGFCSHGCRYDAKQGTLQVWLPRALAAGARLYADAEAERIEVVERGGPRPSKRVHAVVRDPHTGAQVGALEIDAPVVIVAAGAVRTPVLLERSGMGGGGVGEWLRLHPTTGVVGVHDEEVYAAGGLPLTVNVNEFARGTSGYGFWLECPPWQPAFGAAAIPGFGAAHAARMRQFTRLAPVIALTRDGADTPRSSGGVHVDRTGRVRIRYRLTAADAATVRASLAAAARVQLAAGAREVFTLHADPVVVRTQRDLAAIATAPVAPNRLALYSAHVNGTARIGTDPRTSGCTPAGERHGVRGVHVLDGSLLPTGVGVNPQETIMAIVSVLSERLLAGWT
jgi:choline dehydrogenase-like flavoprotein